MIEKYHVVAGSEDVAGSEAIYLSQGFPFL